MYGTNTTREIVVNPDFINGFLIADCNYSTQNLLAKNYQADRELFIVKDSHILSPLDSNLICDYYCIMSHTCRCLTYILIALYECFKLSSE